MALGVNIVSEFNSKGIQKAIRDFGRLEGAGNKSAYALKTFDKAVSNGLANVAKATAGFGLMAGAIGYKLVSAAYESKKVMAQTDAIIKATGGAAGVTAEQVSKLSNKLSMQIGVDDELIQKTANLLLTFKQVHNQVGAGNQIFDRAVVAAQDLGNVFGSADAAALQLGKALSNPVQGISALNRAGITFSQTQKDQIAQMVKNNDLLGAQKLILKEVESQVGGTAAASATGFDKMKVALSNVGETFGGILIPYVEKFATFIINNVVPYLEQLGKVIGSQGVGAGVNMLANSFVNAITNMGAFGNMVFSLITAIVAVRSAVIAYNATMAVFNVLNALAEAGLLGTTAGVWALDAALMANPIGLIVAAIAVLIVALVAVYLKFKIVRDAVALLGNAIAGAWHWLTNIGNKHKDAGDAAGYQARQVDAVTRAYTVMGGSASSTNEKNLKFFRDSETGATALRMEILKGTNAFNGAGGAAETFKDKVAKVVAAMKGLTSEQKNVSDAGKAVKDALAGQAEAHDKVGVALAKFTKISQGYGAASKEAAVQSRAVADAQRSLSKANTSVTDATTNLTKAEEALKKLREKPSALTLDNADISLQQSKLDVEKATFDVLDAEQELADLRTKGDATPEEIRKAEISLQEAKWAQRDATLKVTEAEAALKKLREETPTAEEVAAAERDVADAKLAVEEALIAQQDATQKVNDETLLYSQIVSGAAADSEIYKDALKELNDAKKEEADANQKVTDSYDAQRVAIEKLIQAEIDLAAIKKSSGTAVVAAAKTSMTKTTAAVSKRLPAFASGGIITSPTVGLIGEAGPEAVIPLDQLGGMGGNTYITVNAGMGTDGAEVGKQIIDAIKKAERRSGKVFASA
jgi:hypothetical protein